MEKIRKASPVIGLILGLIMALSGILIIAGVLGGDQYSSSHPSYGFDHGYATFGADAYTYLCNNAADTAEAVHSLNSNLRELTDLIKNISGTAMIITGLIAACFFGMHIGTPVKETATPEAAQPVFLPEEEKTETNLTDTVQENCPAAVPEEEIQKGTPENKDTAPAAVDSNPDEADSQDKIL